MVGRFVQKQKVRIIDQRAAQADAAFFAAGEVVDDAVGVRSGQIGQQLVDARIKIPSVACGDFPLKFMDIDARFRMFIQIKKMENVLRTFQNVFADGFPLRQIDFLRQIGGADAARQRDVARVEMLLSREDFQKG